MGCHAEAAEAAHALHGVPAARPLIAQGQLLRPIAASKGLSIHTDKLPNNSPMVVWDACQMRPAWQYLIGSSAQGVWDIVCLL